MTNSMSTYWQPLPGIVDTSSFSPAVVSTVASVELDDAVALSSSSSPVTGSSVTLPTVTADVALVPAPGSTVHAAAEDAIASTRKA